MPKHTWSFSVKSDSGGGPVDSLVISAPTEVNIGNQGTASTCQGGIADVVRQPNLNIKAANLQSFFIESDQPMRVRTNAASGLGGQEFILAAKKAMGWNNKDLPHGVVNPITVDITDLYFYNLGAAIANVQCGFLLS